MNQTRLKLFETEVIRLIHSGARKGQYIPCHTKRYGYAWFKFGKPSKYFFRYQNDSNFVYCP